MADNTVVHIGENSPEQVAYKLMVDIARAENKDLIPPASSGKTMADREWILSTYYACYKVAKLGLDPKPKDR